ncbi:hypothetical protein BP5796_02225 [Coleophoma crateriformis]|uniref:Uncharacterized protein n=1 Tax=Coleophoma crateriformis TaxID=565419 RepID=A0A3D8SXS2_9HELO|nr:hypothetical protein BP5796_02225 [Coleophoma crateriformis]
MNLTRNSPGGEKTTEGPRGGTYLRCVLARQARGKKGRKEASLLGQVVPDMSLSQVYLVRPSTTDSRTGASGKGDAAPGDSAQYTHAETPPTLSSAHPTVPGAGSKSGLIRTYPERTEYRRRFRCQKESFVESGP